MTNRRRYHKIFVIATALILAVAACVPTPKPGPETIETYLTIVRDPDVRELPLVDNPDPSLCGIPIPWGTDERVWLTPHYNGEPIQSDVLLYDNHLRRSIQGAAPHGTEVRILLYQSNPELDYYLVCTEGYELSQDGWIPAPFVSFEPVE